MELVEYKDKNGDILRSKLLDGFHFAHHVPGNVEQQLADIKNMQCLEDDIYVVEYPKSGFHWIQEILYMIKNGNSDYYKEIVKITDFIPISAFDDTPSPRVFLTHFLPKHLPQNFFGGKRKLIFLHRNPKDIAVSLYLYIRSLTDYNDYDGKWDGFVPLYISGDIPFGSWYDYMKIWKDFMEEHTDKPILVVQYEDMHKDLKKNVKRIAEFLEVDISEDLVNDIVKKCDFNAVKDYKERNKPDIIKKVSKDGSYVMYRKGEVGDWKNWFTKEQNELFHSTFDPHIKKLGFDVQYSL